MNIRIFQRLLCGAAVAASAQTLPAQMKHENSTAAVRQFAQSFYEWYTPIARSDSGPAAETAIKRKPAMFSMQLLTALRADFAASAKAKSEVVGLNFDPFVSGQDPCDRYEVGKVVRQGGSYRVDVHGVCAGKKSESPHVIAELRPSRGSWQFVNFHYPRSDDDLVTVLKILKEHRRKTG